MDGECKHDRAGVVRYRETGMQGKQDAVETVCENEFRDLRMLLKSLTTCLDLISNGSEPLFRAKKRDRMIYMTLRVLHV